MAIKNTEHKIVQGIKNLNIGCGLSKIEQRDWCNLDISPVCEPDLVHDIRVGLPMFEDNSIEEVIAHGVLEQVTHEELKNIMNEIWRVLKLSGILDGQVPSTDPRVLHYDPMDKLFFQKDSLKYFDSSEHAWRQFGRQYGFSPWNIISCEINDNGILCFRMKPVK